MTHVFGLVLLIMALIVHEAGHAIAMMRRGIEIKEAGIGMPVTGRLKLTLHPKFLPFPLIVTPVLIGAFVQPTDRGQQQLNAMGYRDRASCYGAGVIMNILFGAALICVYYFAAHKHNFLPVLVVIAVALGVALLRRLFAMTVPVIGVAAMGFTVYLIMQSPSNIGGPVATVGVSLGASSWAEAIGLGAALSFSLALINMVPMVPLDGGRSMVAMLEAMKLRRISKVYAPVTGVIFTGFFLYTIVSDIIRL